MNTPVVEDYLKAIHEIQKGDEWVKTSALAGKLGVTAGTVTDMIKRLSRAPSRLLTHRSYKGVRLTPAGEKAALNVIRRHRLLETFLHRVFAFSWDDVHEEAEILEHCLSDRLTDAIDDYLGHPRYDPHGEPIPGKDGQAASGDFTPLSAAPLNRPLRVARIRRPEPELLRYLTEIGLHIDARFHILEKAPLDGPVTLRLEAANADRSIGLNAAERILVEVL